MKKVIVVIASLLFLCIVFTGCQKKDVPQTIKEYPLDSMAGILTQSNVAFDPGVSSDGKGSLRIDALSPMTVRLYEVKGIDAQDARLTYQAKLKTKDVEGKVFLEMWCVFSGKGEFFSRALETSLTGTTDWVTQETPFFLKKGQTPETVRLNVVVDGKGTVWIDDAKLIKGPLQ